MAGDEIKIGADDRPIVEPQEGIEELRAKLKEEQDRRLAAEARERKLGEDLQQSRGEVGQTNLQIVESAIDKLQTEREMLKARYREARAAGDIDAEDEIQDQRADLSAKLNQLVLGRDAMKANPQTVTPAASGRTGDPVEDLARGMEAQGHQASADWVRKHPEYARDPDQYREMIAAHNLATGKRFNLKPNSDEYVSKVEEILGIDPATRHEPHSDARPTDTVVSSAATAVRERGADTPPAAAPPSRSTSTGADRLTAAEREAAQISGISEEEYARNKQRKT